MSRQLALVVLSVAFALSLPVAAARAAPPPNDDRVNAAVIPTFPATIAATTVDATVERLDPQVSQCGAIEATVWYQGWRTHASFLGSLRSSASACGTVSLLVARPIG